MARELFEGARRNLRLDVLFNEVYRFRAGSGLDFGSNLYELIAGTFNEQEAAELARKLGFDRLNVGLNSAGLIGWNNDNYYRSKKAETIQQTAVQQGQFSALLREMANIRPNLDLTVFQQSSLVDTAPQDAGHPPGSESQHQSGSSPEDEKGSVQYFIFGDHVGGDKVGRDKVGGDKAGGDIFKDLSISDVSGSTVSLGGDASVGNKIQDVQGDVNLARSAGRDALLKLLAQINQDLDDIKADLGPRDAAEAANTIQSVVEEAQTEKPDAAWIARKLNNVLEIAGAVTAAGQLATHIQQALQVVQSLFSG
jgi:hypothetical protein